MNFRHIGFLLLSSKIWSAEEALASGSLQANLTGKGVVKAALDGG